MNKLTLIIVIIIVGVGIILVKSWWQNDKIIEKTILNKENKTMQKDKKILNFSTEYINLVSNYVKIGEEKSFAQTPALKIKLVDVLKDERCPANVSCFHSGWATVLVEASYNGIVEKKEIYIRGGNSDVLSPPEERDKTFGSGNIISIDQYKMYLVSLNPYPITTRKIEKSDYEGVFLVDNLKNLEFKKKIVRIATDELKKHLADYEKYSAIDIDIKVGDTYSSYTITFVIPFDSANQNVQVKVEYVNNQWKVVDFYKNTI